MTPKKKLIEVALPLEAINVASAREKSIRHGHPSTLHLWWARRPLAAARAVIFAQMVDDPSANPDLFPTEKAQDKERQRLFKIIEKLVQWENTTNEDVLEEARREIWASWRRACAENADHPRAAELFDRNKLPAFHDPFAGGGALPLEAQRLGLEAHATDLNPVAVLINKAMIEIPPKFAGRPPVNPEWHSKPAREKELRQWKGAQGLAEDVRYYGKWMRDEAEKRIGHLYPKIEVTAEMAKGRPDLKPYVGRSLTVIAWLWARTVKSPNPAFAHVNVPLASTFMLSTKAGKEAYVEPVIEDGGYRFTVKVGKPKNAEKAKNGTKLSRGANFECLMSGAPIAGDYIKAEGRAGRMGARMMAIVAEGDRGRVYLAPTAAHEAAAQSAEPEWTPDVEFFAQALGFRIGNYGMARWSDLFTKRQAASLTTLAELIGAGVAAAQADALAKCLEDDDATIRSGGDGAAAYAEAVGLYLGFVLSKQADLANSLCRWEPIAQCPRQLFGRQAIPMIWDYAEGNPLGESSGAWVVFVDGIVKAFSKTFGRDLGLRPGLASQGDAAAQAVSVGKVVSTDPPYYDNIGYADLSDFFYVWLRRALRSQFPELFSTVTVPKAEELVATPDRHGGSEEANAFFLDGMTKAMHRLADHAHPSFPVTIYYAFKQSESDDETGTVSTGWETFLDAALRAGFAVSGTWPVRTENDSRMRGQSSNALASSIVIACRKRHDAAPTITRREFSAALKSEMPAALVLLQRGNIAPVDLAQAAIGPGMAVFTRYSQVLDAEGKPLSVRDALALINQTLDEALAEQEGDFDADTRWALAWFEQSGFSEGEFGVADVLARAKNTSVQGLVEAGVLASSRGKVRLLKPDELPKDWDPTKDKRLTAWEMVHQLVRVLGSEGETPASALVAKLGAKAEVARELCYRLYTVSERKKRAQDALAYNALVQSWPELVRLSREGAKPAKAQADLFAEPVE
jgi:putative DNA methylase